MMSPSEREPLQVTAPPLSAGRLRLAAMAAVAAIALLLWWTGHLGSLVDPERIRRTVERAGPAGPLVFILLLVPLNLVFLAGIPIWMSSSLFPLEWAVVYSIAGAVVGSSGTHLMARWLGREWATSRAPAKLRRFSERVVRNPILAIATMRILLWLNPGVDLFLAVSGVRWHDYLLGTSLGMVLPTALRVFIGQQSMQAASGAPPWILALAVMAVVLFVTWRSLSDDEEEET